MDGTGHEAVLWVSREDGSVECRLCNFRCRIDNGQLGHCGVRRNVGGKLYSLNYGSVCATNVDPIEKKPLFHFQPGKRSFSIATGGCNFHCDFCQNWQISQMPRMEQSLRGRSVKPEEVIEGAKASGCKSIAYTYTEPTVFMELCNDCGKLAKQEGVSNVFVSNGYMTIEALEFASGWLDAINVDLKSYSDDFYRRVCKASLLPVLKTLRYIAEETDIWLEVTTLIVPGLNDSDDELKQIADFIAEKLGPEVPWHISRYHPNFERTGGVATPIETLEAAYDCGKQAGLRYVYVGNMPGGGHENTYCHRCGHLVIERIGYRLTQYNIFDSACANCRTPVAGKGLNPLE